MPPRAAEGRSPVEPPQGAEGGVPPAGRCRDRSVRKEPCPCSTCDVKAHRVREHAVGCHLPPVFRVTVPRCSQADCIRARALRWLSEAVLGSEGSMRALAETLTVEEVFGQRLASWPESFIQGMEDLCRFVDEPGPAVWPTRGTLHPAMLLHWRVQCYILGGLPRAVRDNYAKLLASEHVGNRRLANYPNRIVPPGRGSLLRRTRSLAILLPSRGLSCPLGRMRWPLSILPPRPAPLLWDMLRSRRRRTDRSRRERTSSWLFQWSPPGLGTAR